MKKVFKIDMPNVNLGPAQLSAAIKGFMDVTIAAIDITEEYNKLVDNVVEVSESQSVPVESQSKSVDKPVEKAVDKPVEKLVNKGKDTIYAA